MTEVYCSSFTSSAMVTIMIVGSVVRLFVCLFEDRSEVRT